jgi:hypothetical protein
MRATLARSRGSGHCIRGVISGKARTGGGYFKQIEKAFGGFARYVRSSGAIPVGKQPRQPDIELRLDLGDLPGERYR